MLLIVIALSSPRKKYISQTAFPLSLALICSQHCLQCDPSVYRFMTEPVSAAYSQNIWQAKSYLRWRIDATEIKHRHTRAKENNNFSPGQTMNHGTF